MTANVCASCGHGYEWAGFCPRCGELTPAQGAVFPEETVPAGAGVLDDVARFMRRFVVFADEHQPVALALYVAHTYLVDEADQTPFLHIRSPEKRCGKSRLLEVLALLVQNPWAVVQPSEATLYRKLDQEPKPTLLLDEVDTLLKPRHGDEAAERIRGIINAGNRRTSTVPRCVGPTQQIVEFNIFSAKVLAGIGELPDTVADRSVTIELRRKAPGELPERFRVRKVELEIEPLRTAVMQWADFVRDGLAADAPDLPDALSDRAQDAWEPLLAVADRAGGSWPMRAREAAVKLSGGHDPDSDSLGIRLLADLHDVFDGRTAMHTENVLAALVKLDESPWGDWYGREFNARDLAKYLRPYGIKSKSVWDGATKKGYARDDFHEAWKRYTPDLPRAPLEGSGASGPSGSTSRAQVDTPSDLGTDPPDPPDPSRRRGSEPDPVPTVLDGLGGEVVTTEAVL